MPTRDCDDASDSGRAEQEEERHGDREQEQLVALLVAANTQHIDIDITLLSSSAL